MPTIQVSSEEEITLKLSAQNSYSVYSLLEQTPINNRFLANYLNVYKNAHL